MKSILNGRKLFENKELHKNVDPVRTCEDDKVIVSEYEKMLKNQRSNIIRITSKQGYVLNKFEALKKNCRNGKTTKNY